MKTTNKKLTTPKGYEITLNIGDNPERGSWDYPDGTEGGELNFKLFYGNKYELIDYDGCGTLAEDIVDTLKQQGYEVDHIAETLGYLKTFEVTLDVTYVQDCTVKAKNFEDAIAKAKEQAEKNHSSVRWQTGAFHSATFWEAYELGSDGRAVNELYKWEVEK